MTDFTEDQPRVDPTADHDQLLLNLDGFEGPMDVLLELARTQKVDLAKISILQLTHQFLAFIERAKALRLDLAADYLVMAAWLAYLKSRLLLPRTTDAQNEPSAEAMADALAYQLRRLEAMRAASAALQARAQLGRDFFARGYVDADDIKTTITWGATLYDLLQAYGDIRARSVRAQKYELPTFHLMSMDDALARMTAMLGALPKNGPHTAWVTLSSLVQGTHEALGPGPGAQPNHGPSGQARGPHDEKAVLYTRSSLASLLSASLEMAKQGQIELRQDGAFRPIFLRGVAASVQTKQGEAA